MARTSTNVGAATGDVNIPKNEQPKSDPSPAPVIETDYAGMAKKYGIPAGAGIAGWFIGGMIANKVGKAHLLIKLGTAVLAAAATYKFNPLK